MPYIALAKRLQAAGHELGALSHDFHRERFESHGIRFHPAGKSLTQEDVNEAVARVMKEKWPPRQIDRLLEEAFLLDGKKYFEDAMQVAPEYELGISHFIDFIGAEALIQSGKPRIGVALAPFIAPSSFVPPSSLPNWGKFFNRLLWKFAQAMVRRPERRAMEFLRSIGGTTQTLRMCSSLDEKHNFLAVSPHIAFLPPDIPSHVLVTGHFRLPEEDYQPEAELAAFLERHPRPVVVSLGSMGGTQGEALGRKIVEGIRLSGQPAILQKGYSGLMANNPPENVHFTDWVPHDWLFAHASCVVHHCGAGTTHAAARAGAVSVPVTFMADQPYFANCLHKRQIAVKEIPHDKLRPQKLAQRIQSAIESQELQKRAKLTGALLKAEDGVGEALNAIERWYGAS